MVWAQEAAQVVVTSDAQSQETTYTATSGACRISWIVSSLAINRGVVRQRSACSRPLAEQVPLIAKVMSKVLSEPSDAATLRTLYWGRLYPDGQPDSALAMRLALAAKRSELWDAVRGRPRTGNVNNQVRKLANNALIYAELREMFQKSGLDIQVAAVEKVLVAPAGKLPFFEQLPKGEIKATDRLPYDCMTWFSVTHLGPQRAELRTGIEGERIRRQHSGSPVTMWPFKKKAPTPDQLPIDGPWAISQGEHNGSVMIVRSNTGYAEFGSVPGYEHQVGIAVPLRAPEATGLPSPEENAELSTIEDTLCLALEEHAESLFAAVITTNGMREFVFYTRAPQEVRLRFGQLRDRITTHQLQLMIQPDKDWAVYARLR